MNNKWNAKTADDSLQGKFKIDPANGTIALPNHLSIDADLTQDALRANGAIDDLRSWDRGTLPWIHYQFSGGLLEGDRMQVHLCFYDQVIVTVWLCLVNPNDEYPPFDYESQIEQKERYDDLLCGMLGKPAKGATFWFGRIRKGEDALNHSLLWRYSWGSVASCFDGKGMDVYMHIGYGNRHEEFNKAYIAGRSRQRQ